jgi:NAD(P)-dependent dehydrogenase (short-subunit alcohol dehydrogenase family)
MRPEPDLSPRYPGSGRLAGKVAIITGGDSGIGRATAVLFAREGANVAICYLEEDRDAEDTLSLISEEGGDAIKIRGDVGDKAFCARAVSETVERFGGLHVLVNNASEQHVREDLREIPEDQLERTFRTNIFGMIFMAQAALDHLKEGDAIVNITSVTAYHGQPVLMDYASTKGAIVAFTRSLAKNLASKGIRVNGVAPGPIWTPLIPASFPAEKMPEFGENVPLGRAGEPNEVAPSVLFLACADASYMTGQVLHPNGGSIVGG